MVMIVCIMKLIGFHTQSGVGFTVLSKFVIRPF